MEGAMEPIIFIGFMGAGKTSVGKALALALNVEFLDTDEMIEQQTGQTISKLFASLGEESFRKKETALLRELVNNKPSAIISTGGGMPVCKENRTLLRALGTVIYLKASAEDIWGRLKDDTTRPLLAGANPKEKINTILNEREAFYQETADDIICTSGKEIKQIISEIRRIL